MKTEAEIRQAGMRALIQALGTVEAERFVAALTRDRFDYTEWRKIGLPGLEIEKLSAQPRNIPAHWIIERTIKATLYTHDPCQHAVAGR